jgi:hypothetical protein
LGDWLFDLDVASEVERIVPAVLAVAKNPQKAKGKAKKARRVVEKRQLETMKVLNSTLQNL